MRCVGVRLKCPRLVRPKFTGFVMTSSPMRRSTSLAVRAFPLSLNDLLVRAHAVRNASHACQSGMGVFCSIARRLS